MYVMQAELSDMTRSVQLWQQLRAFSAGMRTGRIDASQFGIQPAQPGVTAFLDAMQSDTDTNRKAQKAAWAQLRHGPGGGADADKESGAEAMDEG